jgi:hypothetical protein
MKPGNGAEKIDILLIVWGQLKTSLELKMSYFTKAACGVDGQVIITRVKNHPKNDPIPRACREPVLHIGIITLCLFWIAHSFSKPLTLTLR